MPHDIVKKAIRVYAEEVIPLVRERLEKVGDLNWPFAYSLNYQIRLQEEFSDICNIEL